MRNRFMERRVKARREAIAKGVAAVILIMVVVVSLPGLFFLFQKIDCYNATNWLIRIEACETDSNCTPTGRMLYAKHNYVALHQLSCPRE